MRVLGGKWTGSILWHLRDEPVRFNDLARMIGGASKKMITERLRQLDTIRHFFSGQMPITLVDMAFVVLFLGALFFISPIIAFLVLGTIPIFLILSLAFHRKQKEEKLIESLQGLTQM